MLMGREHSASSKDHRRFSLQCVTHGIYGGGCRRAWGSYSLVVITAKPYEPPRMCCWSWRQITSALRCASTTGPRRSSRRATIICTLRFIYRLWFLFSYCT
ncbi:hypothetical protein BS78_03G403400 [Paspalum vaginatum]|nr:hypothetical protein BS78_03G403400 [Paspalum vaginatum]